MREIAHPRSLAVLCARIVWAGALAGCTSSSRTLAGSAPESGAEERAVRDAREAQNEAIIAGDIERIASYWTDDVSLRRGLGAVANGRAAYRQIFLDEPTVYLRHSIQVEIGDHWPLAFETGEWEGHERDLNSPVVVRGRYSAQWVKRDGHWLIRGEVFVALNCARIGCAWKSAP